MTTLLIAEHEHATLKDSTNKALTAATQLGAEVHVLVAGGGEGTRAAAEAASKLAGVTKVLVAEGEAYAHDLADRGYALTILDGLKRGKCANEPFLSSFLKEVDRKFRVG